MAREFFCAYHSYLKSMRKLTDEECGRLFRALLTYSITGEETELEGREEIVFDIFSQQIDRDKESYEKTCQQNRKNRASVSGSQQPSTTDDDRQRPSTTDDETTQEEEKEKEEYKEEYKDKGKDEEEGGEAPPTPPSPTRAVKAVKHKYGEHRNVLLTDEELDKLKAKFPDWQNRINNLSWHIGKKGDKYKSHYLTILDWARRDEQQPARAAPSQPKGNYYNPFLEMAGGNVL